MNLPPIIGFAGRKKSGKDTAYSLLYRELPHINVFKVSFADSLKEEIAQAVGCTIGYIDTNKDNFRLILQGWGTDFRRHLCGEDYWIKKWKAKVDYIRNHTAGCLIVATDVRFQNEVDIINGMGGKVYQIEPYNKETYEDDVHESEQLILGKNCGIVANDFKDITVLQTAIKQILQ